jgi:hypothetical protein
MPLPKPGDLFGDAKSPVEIADRFESYKAELNKSLSSPRPAPGPGSFGGAQQPQSEIASLQKALGSADVAKALSPELVDSVRNALAQSDVGKEWTAGTGSNGVPVPGGLVAFDLEAPAKLLTPRPTPLRNRIARRKGVGLAHRFKRITGFTGTGTGGVGIFRPGISEAGTFATGVSAPSFGGLNYLRGATISYAGDDQAVPYKQFSVSDQVSWAAQFSGQGYEDVRQLSQTALLYSSMLLEERLLLGGRGTDSGFSGALAAPAAAPTGTARAANSSGHTGEVALSGVTSNIFVKATALGVWGESTLSAASAAIAVSAGQVVDITIPTDSAGALGYKIYVSTGVSDPGDSARWFMVSTGSNTVTLTGALPTSGTAASSITADTSASNLDYDGLLSYCTGSNAGYVKRINSTLNSGNPGSEFFTAFASLYDSVKADPDEILANGNDRKQLSDLLKNASSASYRITVDNNGEAQNAHLGALVTGLQNEVTGKMVDVTVHPWLPQGNMPIISWTLPLPDSQVSEVFAVYNVQDYMGIQWPTTQFLYESSSYWLGTMVCYAPAWCGAVQGIVKA